MARVNDSRRLAIGSQTIGCIAFSVAFASDDSNSSPVALVCSLLSHAEHGVLTYDDCRDRITHSVVGCAGNAFLLNHIRLEHSLKTAMVLCTVG